MAIHHLNLRLVGKKTHAPGAAGAAMRYFTRAAACQRIDAVGGASTHPKALEREAVRQEEASRKNARICDKFVVSLPAEMSLAERVAVTRAFLVRLTQDGRARAFACYHGQETQNPHVHIMFFDRDSETGKRVQRMTERGGADRIRLMWEEVCNTHLARGGHEDLIDRRSLAAIEQERDAGSVDRLEEIESFDDTDNDETAAAGTTAMAAAPESEAAMSEATPAIDCAETPFPEREPLEKFGYILTLDEELKNVEKTLHDLRTLRERLPQQRDAFERSNQSSVLASGEAALAVKRYAEARRDLETTHMNRFGPLKGFEIGIAGATLFRSRARRAALSKKEEVALAKDAADAAKDAAEFHKNARSSTQRKLIETNEKLTQIEPLMRTYGSEEEARALAADIKRSRGFALDRLEQLDVDRSAAAEQISGGERDPLHNLKRTRQIELNRQTLGLDISH